MKPRPGLTIFVGAVGVAGIAGDAHARWRSCRRRRTWSRGRASRCSRLWRAGSRLPSPASTSASRSRTRSSSTSAVLFGPAPATVSIALDSLVMTVRYRNGQRLQRILFNMTRRRRCRCGPASRRSSPHRHGPAVRIAPGGRADHRPAGVPGDALLRAQLGLTAIAVGLEKRQSPFVVWRRHFAIISLNYFGAASAAFFLFVVVQYLSLMRRGRGHSALRHLPRRDAVVDGTAVRRRAARRPRRSPVLCRRSKRSPPPSKPRTESPAATSIACSTTPWAWRARWAWRTSRR